MQERPAIADQQTLLAGAAIRTGAEGRPAADAAVSASLQPLDGHDPDLLLLFASDAYAADYPEVLAAAAQQSGAPNVVGCSGSGVIGLDHEVEGTPAIAALAIRLPEGSFANVRHVLPQDVPGEHLRDEAPWQQLLGIRPSACRGLVVLADPFTTDTPKLIETLAQDYPSVPIIGGLASSNGQARASWVFAGGQPHEQGAVVIAFAGNVAVRTLVSQGCQPIGEPWTITDADGHLLKTIGNRPAYEVLAQTIKSLDETERRRATRNLLVGIAIDEYRDSFGRGDFLIRNLMGADPSSGIIGVGTRLRVGQTLQFQVRDARAADAELRELATAAAGAEPKPAAALLFACNGRGTGLFREPDHDARIVRELLGPVPLAGFFCNGEIGPVGGQPFLHGFTASIGLLAASS